MLTTFTVLADMARNVAGDRLVVESVTKPGSDIHEYEPTPSDLAKAARADLVLANGFGLESWLDQFVRSADAPHVTLTEGIRPVPVASGERRGLPNPHAWMSPRAARTYVGNIREALTRLDPDGAAVYRRNAAAYLERIEAIGHHLRTRLSGLPAAHRALVTCEGAFSYLARDAGLREAYLWPVNSDAEGTPQQVIGTIRFVERHDVPAVFCESTVNDQAQRQVARQTGARMGGTLYVDSLSGPSGPVPTYLALLRHDAETIVAGLRGAPS